MRKMYTTKRLLGSVACAAAMFVAVPVMAQDVEVAEEVELFDKGDKPGGQKVEVGETGAIDLHVKELEITKVLQLLSIQSKRNIIASRGVENAKVSADLYGVDFYQALESILSPNGFGYVEEGNFIYVLTEEELAKRIDKNRKVVTRIHRLNYLRADEAAGFVTPMLSENGAITASGNVEDGIDATLDNVGSDQYAGPPTLVIRDYEDSVEEILVILQELDRQPKQVIIEATVLRATLSESNQFGVDFSLFTDLTGTSPLDIIDGAISGGAPDNQRLGAVQSNVGNVAAQSGGMKLGFVAGDAAVFVSALDSVTDTTVIATPKVTVLDRQRTSILVGEKVAYLSTTVTETSETQTVEFLEVGTQLNVRPFVSSDGKVRLELRPSVSSAEIRTIGTTDAPDESTVELHTNVIVESGQTIVLGGLISDSTSIGRSQVPGLGDVPILGAAFQGQDDTIDRSEVIFMVKATVVENETLIALGNEATDKVQVARLAEREATLPWSRSKLTASHMVNARRQYDEALSLEGEARDKKMAKALYCVDMALHMNPSMVDALILKEQITGEASYIKYEESIVTSTYDAVLDAELKALGVPEMPEPEVEAAPEQPAQGEELIQPEPLTDAQQPAAETAPAEEAQADASAEVAPAEPAEEAQAEVVAEEAADPQAQADADNAWLEAVLAEQFGEQDAAPAEQPAEEAPAQTADADDAQPADETVVELVEVVEAPAEEEADTQADADEVETESDTQADADTETDNSTADVPTQTD